MGRPKGSKNKVSVIPIEEVPWQPKVKTQQTVPSARPPKKRGSPAATDETISEPSVEETSLFGSQCVESATTKEQSDLAVRRVSGFINIQANPRGGWYSGCDIHETVEKAKAVSSRQTITQVFIAFEVKG